MIQAWVATATAAGLSNERACAVLGLAPRTLQRWQRPARPTLAARDARPRPVNALTRPEAATVVSVIRSPEHADESCRELAASLAHGIPAISVSSVSVWRYQVALKCNGPRGRQVHARHLGAPDTDWVTGPHQLWDGDVTWLTTTEAHVFLYLYSLIDHFSRKVVAWFVRDAFTSDHWQALWDQGLINEGLLDQPRAQWPASATAGPKGARIRPASPSPSSGSANCSAGRAPPTTLRGLKRTLEPSKRIPPIPDPSPTRRRPRRTSPASTIGTTTSIC